MVLYIFKLRLILVLMVLFGSINLAADSSDTKKHHHHHHKKTDVQSDSKNIKSTIKEDKNIRDEEEIKDDADSTNSESGICSWPLVRTFCNFSTEGKITTLWGAGLTALIVAVYKQSTVISKLCKDKGIILNYANKHSWFGPVAAIASSLAERLGLKERLQKTSWVSQAYSIVNSVATKQDSANTVATNLVNAVATNLSPNDKKKK